MSQTLYEKIKNEKNAIETTLIENGKEVNVQNVSGLLKERLIGQKDSLVVLCAFYEYMNERSQKEYAFIKQEPWSGYFKTNISKCFTTERINMHKDEIAGNEVLKDIIYNVCDETIKDAFNTMITEKTNNEINSNPNASINATLVAQVSNDTYQKLNTRLTLFNDKLNIESKTNLDDKPFKTSETIFDKMAKCPNDVLVSIMNNLKKKKDAFVLASSVKKEERKEILEKISCANVFSQDKKIIALAGTHVATKPLINSGLSQKSM